MSENYPIYIDRIQNIQRTSGVVSFVSYGRLVNESIKEAIGLRENERIIGVQATLWGLNVYVEYV